MVLPCYGAWPEARLKLCFGTLWLGASSIVSDEGYFTSGEDIYSFTNMRSLLSNALDAVTVAT